METIRLVVALACNQGWSTFYLDVKSSFLNGPLEEEIYVTQPPGFVIQKEASKVYRLHKALYGLKQAPRAWNKKIDSYLVELGFVKCKSEYGVYVQVVTQDITIICLYIDDFLVTGNSLKNLSKFKEMMTKEFEMLDLGKLSYFLGMEFQIMKKGMMLHQRKYVKEILKIFKMDNLNSASSLVEPNVKMEKNGEEEKVDVTLSSKLWDL